MKGVNSESCGVLVSVIVRALLRTCVSLTGALTSTTKFTNDTKVGIRSRRITSGAPLRSNVLLNFVLL